MVSNSAYGQKVVCALIFVSEGRLKSPPIDGFSWSKSIAGDFNRPSDATIMFLYGIADYS
jgi:hypothetical protein